MKEKRTIEIVFTPTELNLIITVLNIVYTGATSMHGKQECADMIDRLISIREEKGI